MQRIRAGAAVALLAVLAGCGTAGDIVAEGSGAADFPTGILLSTSVTEDDVPRPTILGKPVRLSLGPDGRFFADDRCFSVQGTAEPVDGTLDVTLDENGGVCSADGDTSGPGTPSAWLEEFFGADPAYVWDDGELELRSGEIEMVLVPREVLEPDAPLAGTAWQIFGRAQGLPRGTTPAPGVSSSPASDPIGAPAQLVFADGLVRGTVGCVAFSGPASVHGGDVVFGKVGVDKAACTGRERYLGVGPAGVLAVLSGTVAWEVDYTKLALTRHDGRQLSLRSGSLTPDQSTAG